MKSLNSWLLTLHPRSTPKPARPPNPPVTTFLNRPQARSPWTKLGGPAAVHPGQSIRSPRAHVTQQQANWRYVDAAYTALTRAQRLAWHNAVKRRGNSAYDLWMKENLELCRQRRPISLTPSISGGFSASKVTPTLDGSTTTSPACIPGPPCPILYCKFFQRDINPDHLTIEWSFDASFPGLNPTLSYLYLWGWSWWSPDHHFPHWSSYAIRYFPFSPANFDRIDYFEAFLVVVVVARVNGVKQISHLYMWPNCPWYPAMWDQVPWMPPPVPMVYDPD